MAVVSFPARNKLAYPAGRLPGFDASHVASRGAVASIIPMAGNAINLAKFGQGASPVLAPKIDGALGPAATFTNGPTFSITAPSTAAGFALTYAAFVRPTLTGGNQGMVSVVTGGGGPYCAIIAAATFAIRDLGVANFDSGVAAATGIPYFYAASLIYNGSTYDHNHVVLRLDTGSVTPVSVTGTASSQFSSSLNTVTWGGFDAGNPNSGTVGPAMVGLNNFLNIQQLLQFAQDPWAFWYPPQASSQVAAAAATPTTVLYSLMNVG